MLKNLIHRPIAVTMALIAIVILGLASANLIPVSLMPNIKIPKITVQVNANMSAEEIDKNIVASLRNNLLQVSSIKDIKSETRDGVALLHLTFSYGSDIDYSFIEVNENIDKLMPSFPPEVKRPNVIKARAEDIPAFYLNITLNENQEGEHVSQRFVELCDFTENVIGNRLKQLPEVAMVDVSGLVDKEMFIIPNTERLMSLGIDEAALSEALGNNNVKLGNLTIRDGEYHYNVRFNRSLTSVEDVENVYVKVGDKLIKIKELASVQIRPKPRNGFVRAEGKDAISIAVIKQSDAKMADMKKSINTLVDDFRKTYPHLNFEITRNQTELLDYSISNLKSNLLVGALLACLIIFLFMKDLKTPMLIMITIPITLIVSLLFFHLFKMSINIISLSGLVLGMGMMVDNSIIVIDNIVQWRERGVSLVDSVVGATKEVVAPMLSSVLTTCSVFVPLIFLSGIAGAMFYDQAMAVTITLFTSLAVSVTVIPVYFYCFYKKEKAHKEKKYNFRITLNYKKIYEQGIRWVFRHQKSMFALFFGAIAFVFIIYQYLDKERLPQISTTDILMHIEWNEKISADENGRLVEEMMQEIGAPIQYTAMVGQQGYVLKHTTDLDRTETLMYFSTGSTKELSDLKDRFSAYMSKNHQKAVFEFSAASNIFEVMFADNEAMIVAKIRGTAGGSLSPVDLNKVLNEINAQLPDANIRPVVLSEQMVLTCDLQKMALYGVRFEQLDSKLRTMLNQNEILKINNNNYTLPIVVGSDREAFHEQLNNATIKVDSISYPLSQFLVETRDEGYKVIYGGSEGNYYPLGFDVADGDTKDLMRIVKDVCKEKKLEVSFEGSYFSNRAMIRELIVVLIISLLLLYFILSAQFESLLQPLIILSEVVVDICGAFIIMALCGVSINLMSMIGLIVMCGIIINDSILKVDTINRLRKNGYSLLRAIITGGDRRIKPILMTSLTTILALVPFLQRGDMGSDLQYPMSVALIGGMVVGTIVSLYFIPLLYYVIYKKRR